jgi:hypothetical protein
MPKVTLRPTIAADLSQVIGEPLPYRIRAITGIVDGRVIGIGGIAFPPAGPVIAFAQLASAPSTDLRGERGQEGIPEARRFPVAFHRAGLLVVEMIRESGVHEVVATADPDSEVAARWLTRLGFMPAVFQRIDGRLLFVWMRDNRTGAKRRVNRPQISDF